MLAIVANSLSSGTAQSRNSSLLGKPRKGWQKNHSLQLGPKSEAYQQVGGKAVFIRKFYWKGPQVGDPFWLFSTDGKLFLEARMDGVDNREEYRYSRNTFLLPNLNRSIVFEYKDGVRTIDGKRYRQIAAPKQVMVKPLPHVQEPKKLFQTKAGEVLYYSVGKWSGEQRLYYGKTLKQPLQQVELLQTGTSTNLAHLTSRKGILHWYSPERDVSKATWNDQPISELPLHQYLVKEEKGQATIKAKGK